MSRWHIPFRAREYVRGSLWITPLIGGLAGVALAQVVLAIDASTTLPSGWRYSEATASAVLTVIVGAMVGLTGIVVAIGVLIVQSATGTLSPRFMRLWYRDRLQKAVLACFIGTLAFAYALLRRLSATAVPDVGVTLAGVAVGAGIVLFLLYLDRFVHRLRPVGVAALVAGAGGKVFEGPSQGLGDVGLAPVGRVSRAALTAEPVLDVPAVRSGVIQAIAAERLVRAAADHDCLFVLPFAIGDFVPRGATLLEVFGDASQLNEQRLRGLIGLGRERSIEQDPAFALRVLVDIAIRALSPAVNDPTTAVQVLDHIEDLLQHIGSSELLGRGELCDARGRPCVVLPVRGWEEYLALGVTEIREYGRSAPQVTRRLRATLETLLASVRPENRRALELELGLLDAALARGVTDPVLRDFASRADRQGIGGPAHGVTSPATQDPRAATGRARP